MEGKNISHYQKHRLFFLLSLFLFINLSVQAIEQTQEIALKKGWNAIYFEVDPVISEQNISAFIFKSIESNSSIPIEIISTYFPNNSVVEYINSPDEAVWKKPSWNSWIRDDFPESFLTNLYDLKSGQAYLIKSSQDFTWKIKGEVAKITTNWQPNSFNFVGFQVTDNSGSFYNLFQNVQTAITLQTRPIYTLNNGVWEKVSLVDEAVKQGKAYWIFANGNSNFQGSVELAMDDGAKVMNFLDIAKTKIISIKNRSTLPKIVTLSLEKNQVPLSLVEKNSLAENIYTPVTTIIKKIILSPNSETLVKVAIRRNEIKTTGKREGILKMEVEDTHEVQYIPISAYGDT